MKVLAVNAGSSSIKLELVDTSRPLGVASTQPAAARVTVRLRNAELAVDIAGRSPQHESDGTDVDVPRAVRIALAALADATDSTLDRTAAIGHRIVHGGQRVEPTVLGAAVLEELETAGELAPLHNGPALQAVAATAAELGERPAVAVFDTSFFRSLPPQAATYALPADLAERHGIRRLGFHGISHAYLARRWRELAGRGADESRIVTLHLGSGCSAAAIVGERPVDTSMGFTPLEGLVMATRGGDVDPGALLHLLRSGVGVDELDELLNRSSGLLGVSGISGDVRDLLRRASEGDSRAALALEVYGFRARKYVGAYVAALEGADALLFTGGVGENLPEIRSRICAGMEWCGLELDPELNPNVVGVEARVSREAARMQVWVVPAREELWIAYETARVLGG